MSESGRRCEFAALKSQKLISLSEKPKALWTWTTTVLISMLPSLGSFLNWMCSQVTWVNEPYLQEAIWTSIHYAHYAELCLDLQKE